MSDDRMTTADVVGIDLSLTSTGIARICFDGNVAAKCVESKGKANATLAQRWGRLSCLHGGILAAVCTSVPIGLVVIEAPAFSSRQGSTHDRSGLWWRVVDHLMASGIPVAEIPPTCRAKYATGKGTAGKDQVLLAVSRRYPDVNITNNDEADALVLAAMGARYLGHPIDDLPKTHLAAMDKIRWPETETA